MRSAVVTASHRSSMSVLYVWLTVTGRGSPAASVRLPTRRLTALICCFTSNMAGKVSAGTYISNGWGGRRRRSGEVDRGPVGVLAGDGAALLVVRQRIREMRSERKTIFTG